MSKSLGNFFTVHDLLEQGVPGEVIRFVFLGTHYRKPMDWTEKKRAEAEGTLRKWRKMTKGVVPTQPSKAFLDALADDLNFPAAMAELHRLSRNAAVGEMIIGQDHIGQVADPAALLASAQLVGLLTDELGKWAEEIDLSGLAQKLHEARLAAMQAKDFSAVDALKAALTEAGVQIRMSKESVELEPGPGFDASKLEGL